MLLTGGLWFIGWWSKGGKRLRRFMTGVPVFYCFTACAWLDQDLIDFTTDLDWVFSRNNMKDHMFPWWDQEKSYWHAAALSNQTLMPVCLTEFLLQKTFRKFTERQSVCLNCLFENSNSFFLKMASSVFEHTGLASRASFPSTGQSTPGQRSGTIMCRNYGHKEAPGSQISGSLIVGQ